MNLQTDDGKINFVVELKTGGGFAASAVGFPIRAEGGRMRDLRRNAESAVLAHFGRGRNVVLLVGGIREGTA